MKLTDAEKRNIVSLIEKGEFLPDDYKFKLFKGAGEIELSWNGKSNDITNSVLPFQIIEHVDEPRENEKLELQGNLFDERGRQLRGWTNKLIWGNNSLILSSLINGQLRNEIENNGGLKLVYIDPPFDVGDDFELTLEIGGKSINKKRNALEQLAFSDTWGKGEDSFLSMIYERIKLIYSLLAEDGSIYVHCDRRVNHVIKLVMIEIFGKENFVSEIQFQRSLGHHVSDKIDNITDTILLFKKNVNFIFNPQYEKLNDKELKDKFPYVEKETGRKFTHEKLEQSSNKSSRDEIRIINGKKTKTNIGWRWSQKTFDERIKENPHIIFWTEKGRPRYKRYADEYEGRKINNLWNDIKLLSSNSSEHLGYPTQKPEDLLERIILQSSNEGDLIADFFCGSGTTLAVAEKLNRKWIGSDLGKFAIHTSRKRLINIQRNKKNDGKDFRAFEVLNLGKYQREFLFKDYLANSRSLKNEKSEEYYYRLILEAYKAQPVENLKILKGVKVNRFIAIGPFNLQVTRLFVQKVIEECLEKKITQVDILGFEFEMGLFPNIREIAAKQGIDLNCLYIPNEVFDKNAVKRNQIIFYNTAYINAEILYKKNDYQIKLKGYAIFDSDSIFEETLSGMSNDEKRELFLNDSIIKISKDKNGKITKNIVKMKWSDWIDYWAIDFDFESKKETLIEDGKTMTTGDFVFENEWQSFRTKESDIEFVSPLRKITKGKKIAIKVIDIFGNDTMKIFEL
tara:strand:- start:2569 stop:4782 length:2214 start_codon:yes stop_codon:yes gene_type:complete